MLPFTSTGSFAIEYLMSTRMIGVIISMSLIMIGLFVANIFAMLMEDELDRRIPGRVGDSFSHWRKVRSFSEYRTVCPAGKLHIYSLTAFVIAMTGFVGLSLSLLLLD